MICQANDSAYAHGCCYSLSKICARITFHRLLYLSSADPFCGPKLFFETPIDWTCSKQLICVPRIEATKIQWIAWIWLKSSKNKKGFFGATPRLFYNKSVRIRPKAPQSTHPDKPRKAGLYHRSIWVWVVRLCFGFFSFSFTFIHFVDLHRIRERIAIRSRCNQCDLFRSLCFTPDL